VLAALRARISDRYGADFLAEREVELEARLAALAPFAQPPLPAVDAERELPLVDAWSAQAADLAAAQTALELLREAPALRAGSSFALPGALAPRERELLCGFREAAAEELVALAGAPHPGWGPAFLVGAARLLALERSCAGGVWVVLDVFAGAETQELPAPRAEALEGLLSEARDALARARARLVAGAWSGRRLANVESIAGLARELRRAAQSGRLRVSDTRVPQRSAAHALSLPRSGGGALLADLRAREREAERAFSALHGYHLASHNCVSELLAVLDAELGVRSAAGAERSVPFLSVAALRRRLPLAGERVIPSLRSLRIAAGPGGPLARLRELSPASAGSYAPAAADSRFLLFTDSLPPLRPLFGAANLAAGAGVAALGLLRAPWDGGAQLSAGLRGAFWSLPELAFFSVRKGTNEYVAPEWIAWAQAQASPSAQRKNTSVTSANSGISTPPE
jgi:hypothetical protein